MPVTKGCIPDAPEGGHSTHAGTLLDGAAVVVAEEPLELPRDDELDTAPVPLGRVLVVPLPPVPVVPFGPAPEVPLAPVPMVPPAVDAVRAEELPPVDAVAVEPVVAPVVGCRGTAGLADVTAELVAALPSATTPLLVTLPGVVTGCADAGAASANITAERTERLIAPHKSAFFDLVNAEKREESSLSRRTR